MRFISLILIGFLGCDDDVTVDPPEGGGRTDGAQSEDGGPADAAPVDRGFPPIPDASSDVCSVDVREADGTLLGRCVLPAQASCQALAECLCTFPVEPAGFGDCLTAITMPRALINLSDMCGGGRQSVAEVVRNPDWRATWDQGRYLLAASTVCEDIPASF